MEQGGRRRAFGSICPNRVQGPPARLAKKVARPGGSAAGTAPAAPSPRAPPPRPRRSVAPPTPAAPALGESVRGGEPGPLAVPHSPCLPPRPPGAPTVLPSSASPGHDTPTIPCTMPSLATSPFSMPFAVTLSWPPATFPSPASPSHAPRGWPPAALPPSLCPLPMPIPAQASHHCLAVPSAHHYRLAGFSSLCPHPSHHPGWPRDPAAGKPPARASPPQGTHRGGLLAPRSRWVLPAPQASGLPPVKWRHWRTMSCPTS